MCVREKGEGRGSRERGGREDSHANQWVFLRLFLWEFFLLAKVSFRLSFPIPMETSNVFQFSHSFMFTFPLVGRVEICMQLFQVSTILVKHPAFPQSLHPLCTLGWTLLPLEFPISPFNLPISYYLLLNVSVPLALCFKFLAPQVLHVKHRKQKFEARTSKRKDKGI